MCESDVEQSKREFYYYENKNDIENDDFVSRYTYVRYVF